MPKVDLLNMEGKKVGTVELAESVFAAEVNESVMHEVVLNYLANQRQGTQSTKTRSEVSGGGKKPWKQKGTGRARQGSSREPQMVGGGVVFGPTGIQNFKIKQNRKAARLALKSVLTEKASEQNLVVVDEFNFEAPKTKEFVKVLDAVKAGGKVLFVATEEDDATILSARNLQFVKVVYPQGINVYDIVNVDTLLVSEAALKTIEEVFA